MKIIFAGTPQFAASALEVLIPQYEIVAVLTQPDRPAGRGMKLVASPVKQLALQHSLQVLQPTTLKAEDIQQQLIALQADVMVVAAYGLILPQTVLQIPRLGCLNIHASLLPRWRGAAPIQRAILAGDAETGITIMQMDKGLDTGAMLLKSALPIAADDTAATLHDKLAQLGAQAIMQVLDKLAVAMELTLEIQDEAQANYAAKLSKEEAKLDWQQDATILARAVRAYNPFPIAQAVLRGTILKIWQAEVCQHAAGQPGTVLAVEKNHILVACGQYALALQMLQRPGGKPLSVTQFVQGFPIQVGDVFESA